MHRDHFVHEQDSIKSRACADEVFYFEKMEVSDFRNDVLLAEACRADVDKFCKHVEPGALHTSPLLARLSVSTRTATPLVCKHMEPDACLVSPPSGCLDLNCHFNCLRPWAAAGFAHIQYSACVVVWAVSGWEHVSYC